MVRAQPKKLRDGSWGIIIFGQDAKYARPGQMVQVRTKAGKTWTTEVGRVLWRGKDAAICTTPPSESSTPQRRRSRTGECTCGYCDDLLSFGYSPGQRIRCPECGGWGEAC